MNRDAAKSPIRETRIPLEVPEAYGQLSFSVPMTSSVAPTEPLIELGNVRDDEHDKKKSRNKPVGEPKTKRKETTTSISNFFHRFTRSEEKKEIKHKSVGATDESPGIPDRPDCLPISPEEPWSEDPGVSYQDALEHGHEGDTVMYEWKPDSLEETLVTERNDAQTERQRGESTTGTGGGDESSLSSILEDFRGGKMRSFHEDQLAAMRNAKAEHEQITMMHLAINDNPPDQHERLDQLYDELSDRLYKMHSMFTVPSAAP